MRNKFDLKNMRTRMRINPTWQWILLGLLWAAPAPAQTNVNRPDIGRQWFARPLAESASRGIVTRDPSNIVKCADDYWVFYTGRGIPSYHSKDLVHWKAGPSVFEKAPEWISVRRFSLLKNHSRQLSASFLMA